MPTFEDVRANFTRRPFHPFVIKLTTGYELFVDFVGQGVASRKNVVVNDYRKKVDRHLRYEQIAAVLPQPASYRRPAAAD